MSDDSLARKQFQTAFVALCKAAQGMGWSIAVPVNKEADDNTPVPYIIVGQELVLQQIAGDNMQGFEIYSPPSTNTSGMDS